MPRLKVPGYTTRKLEIQPELDKANGVLKSIYQRAIDDTDYYLDIKRLGRQANEKFGLGTTRMAGDAIQNENAKRKPVSPSDRIKLGDKDMRSMLAEEKLRVASDLAGGGYSRDQLVDMLNQPGVQSGEQLLDAYNSDPRMSAIFELGKEGAFLRPESNSDRFIGEGQFGRVSEFAPGYVIKEQAPLVEWGGYKMTDGGSQSDEGNLIGEIYDYRDVKRDVDQLNLLNQKNITPKVENFTVNPDGSTEVIMRDLRDNYDTYSDILPSKVAELESESTSPQRKAELMMEGRLFEVKRKQQESIANLQGIEMGDRHEGNVMKHKMTGRPLQIDPSGTEIDNVVERDQLIADKAIKGIAMAGAEEEAELLQGLFMEAMERGDTGTMHDLAQQGMSRLMKINKVVLNQPRAYTPDV